MTIPSFSFPVSDLPAAPAPVLPPVAAPPVQPAAVPVPAAQSVAAPVSPNPPPALNIGQARINPGPGIPPELVGRTINEALSLYSTVKQEAIRQIQASALPAAAAPAAPAAPAAGQPAQVASFWRDPDAAIDRIVAKRVQEAVGSVQAPAQIQAARNMAAQQLGADFIALEPYINQKLQGASPELLAQPETWGNMFNLVWGQAVRSGWKPPSQSGQPAPVAPAAAAAPPPAFAAPQFSMPASGMNPNAGQPWAHPGTFFTESPSGGAPAGASVALTPAEADAAQRMGMTQDMYRAWKGGGR